MIPFFWTFGDVWVSNKRKIPSFACFATFVLSKRIYISLLPPAKAMFSLVCVCHSIHWSMYGREAGDTRPTGMISCFQMRVITLASVWTTTPLKVLWHKARDQNFMQAASNISWSGSCPNTSFMVKADWSFLHLHSCGCCQCGSFYETSVSSLMDKI